MMVASSLRRGLALCAIAFHFAGYPVRSQEPDQGDVVPEDTAQDANSNGNNEGQEGAVLKAIRSGKIKITPEMIEAQKAMHPEMQVYTDQEIQDRLMNGKGASAEAAPKKPNAAVKLPAKAEKKAAGGKAKGKSEEEGEGDGGGRFPKDLPRFGYDFFMNAPAGGASGRMPSLPEYVLSPGDELMVSTWGREDQRQTVIVDPEGMVRFPPLSPMRVGGMRFEDAERLLSGEIQKIQGMRASIAMGKLRSIRVFVLGEVANPGSYVVTAGATVTSALFQSGGIKEIGSLRGIQIRRNGAVIGTLDLYEMLLKGNNKGDRQLLTGDAVFVPVAPIQIAVTGMVKRPAVYEVKPGTKVAQALELAGGLSSNAFKGRVRLDRIESYKRKIVLDIPMEKMGANAGTLQDGDLLNIDQVLAQEYDVVYLKGNVNRPGRYEFKKGMTVKDLIPSMKDLKSETFFEYGHIKRPSEGDDRSLLLPFSLVDVFDRGVSVPLSPRDTIMVYSRYDIMDKPVVAVMGMVRKPGTYGFVDQMRVSDLLLAGGGLTIDAYLPEAHILRVLESGKSDSLRSKLIKVNLSGLISNPGDEGNTELRPFDSLVVFPRGNFVLPKSVSVNGAVKKPGMFELSEGTGISELISEAQGLTKNSFKVRVEVVRRTIQKDSIVRREIHQLPLGEIMQGKVSFPLQDGDAVYIREVVDYRGQVAINLAGEFNFPGRYEVAKGEKLSDVIRRAGGFTESAYLRGLVFIRKSVKVLQVRHAEEIGRRLQDQTSNLMARTTDEKERTSLQIAIGRRQQMVEEIKRAPYLGRVVLKLDSKYKFTDTDWDIGIEDGDSLWIGQQPNVVAIMGEVFSPTNVVFNSKARTVGRCLSNAGGVTEYGDEGNIYYIQPDGAVVTPKTTWFFSSTDVEPGGSIIVPPKAPKKDYLDALTKITQIIYQIAISVGVAKTVF